MPGGHPPLWTLGYIQRPNICISVNFAHSIRLLRYKDFKPLSCREVFFNVDNTVSLDLDTSWVSANLYVYVRHTGYPPTIRKKYQTGRSIVAIYAPTILQVIASQPLPTQVIAGQEPPGV